MPRLIRSRSAGAFLYRQVAPGPQAAALIASGELGCSNDGRTFEEFTPKAVSQAANENGTPTRIRDERGDRALEF